MAFLRARRRGLLIPSSSISKFGSAVKMEVGKGIAAGTIWRERGRMKERKEEFKKRFSGSIYHPESPRAHPEKVGEYAFAQKASFERIKEAKKKLSLTGNASRKPYKKVRTVSIYDRL